MQKMLTGSNTTFKLFGTWLLSSQEYTKNSKHKQKIKMYRIKADPGTPSHDHSVLSEWLPLFQNIFCINNATLGCRFLNK